MIFNMLLKIYLLYLKQQRAYVWICNLTKKDYIAEFPVNFTNFFRGAVLLINYAWVHLKLHKK